MALEETNLTQQRISLARPTINSTEEGNTTMADTIIAQPQDGLLGGGTLGGLILGSMFAGNRGFGFGYGMDGAAAGYAARGIGDQGTTQILQALNQSIAANGLVNTIQDINRVSHDVAKTGAETQAAIGASTLSNVTSNLQGQAALTDQIHSSTISTLNGASQILGAMNGLASDINGNVNQATNVIGAEIHDLGTQFTAAINQTQNEINRSTNMLLGAAHSAEVNQLKSAYDIKSAVLEDGDKTRALINNNTIMDLQRQLVEARDNHRHDRTTSDLIINNNNNNNNLLAQQQQAQQQQQISTLANGLSAALTHLNNIQQISIATGRNNTITPNAVNV